MKLRRRGGVGSGDQALDLPCADGGGPKAYRPTGRVHHLALELLQNTGVPTAEQELEPIFDARAPFMHFVLRCATRPRNRAPSCRGAGHRALGSQRSDRGCRHRKYSAQGFSRQRGGRAAGQFRCDGSGALCSDCRLDRLGFVSRRFRLQQSTKNTPIAGRRCYNGRRRDRRCCRSSARPPGAARKDGSGKHAQLLLYLSPICANFFGNASV